MTTLADAVDVHEPRIARRKPVEVVVDVSGAVAHRQQEASDFAIDHRDAVVEGERMELLQPREVHRAGFADDGGVEFHDAIEICIGRIADDGVIHESYRNFGGGQITVSTDLAVMFPRQ